MTPTGLEPEIATSFGGNDLEVSQFESGAKSGAILSLASEVDQELGDLIRAWPALTDFERKEIGKLVAESFFKVD